MQEYIDKNGGRKALLSGKAVSGRKRKAEDSPQVKVTQHGKKGKQDAPSRKSNIDAARANDKYPSGSWEDYIAGIDYIEETVDARTGQLVRNAYVHWSDGKHPVHTKHSLATMYKKCPQKMLRYYESHLVFRNQQPAKDGGDDATGLSPLLGANGE